MRGTFRGGVFAVSDCWIAAASGSTPPASSKLRFACRSDRRTAPGDLRIGGGESESSASSSSSVSDPERSPSSNEAASGDDAACGAALDFEVGVDLALGVDLPCGVDSSSDGLEAGDAELLAAVASPFKKAWMSG
mmetsp:Transcript_25300/g.37269  ORF Transcript_25300/g.37269 Transcript_25300/m.37269 type:complete len:135 (+) Transcript_25300:618-1022(+)